MAPTTPSVWAVLATALAVGPTAPAGAQDNQLPPCPDADELIRTDVPYYLRVGEALAFTIERENTNGVQQVLVTYPGATGPQDEFVSFPEGMRRLRMIRPAPTSVKRFGLAFAWEQNVGNTDACRGSDRYRAIPIVAKDATIGRPKVARLSGRYRARYPREPAARWRLHPGCDVFGCKTRLRSSGGLRGTLVPDDDGNYVLNRRERAGNCRIEFANGATRTFGIYLHTRVTLTVKRQSVEGGLALRLVGRRTTWYDAPADELNLCNVAPKREVRRVRVRRSGS